MTVRARQEGRWYPWTSWLAWRRLAGIAPIPSACPVCWGQGWVLEPVMEPVFQEMVLGYMPVQCERCQGTAI